MGVLVQWPRRTSALAVVAANLGGTGKWTGVDAYLQMALRTDGLQRDFVDSIR